MRAPQSNQRQNMVAKAVEESVCKTYATNKGFSADPGIKLGESFAYAVSYTDHSGAKTYVRYAFDNEKDIVIYNDLYALMANHSNFVEKESFTEQLRVCGLFILSLSMVFAVVYTAGNDKVSNPMVGLLGAAIGYIAGNKMPRNRGDRN